MHIPSYPKVWAIGHKAVVELFAGPLTVEEKIDGSQLSFMRNGNTVYFRSKGAEIFADAPEKMFALGVRQLVEIGSSLHEGWIYRSEYLSKPKHNVLAYGRVPRRNVILFDINTGDETYLSRAEKEVEAKRVGLDIVPVLHEGTVRSPEELLALLECESILGNQKVEGIVVKNYARFGLDKKVLMGKFVREEYKEKHAQEWKASNPTVGDVIDRIIATLRSEGHWEKAIQHLRERGELEESPRDIGKLIKEAQKDIAEEEMDFIKQKLAEWAVPRIIRASTAGLPEWYKRRLLDSAFNAGQTEPSIPNA